MPTKGKHKEGTYDLVGQNIQVQSEAKCLDLSPEKSVVERVHQARHTFFALGAFQGRLNPLTGRSSF